MRELARGPGNRAGNPQLLSYDATMPNAQKSRKRDREAYSVYGVFTPTTQATLNFVPREAVNDQLVDALRTPGKQLIVYGESGSGKSTLLLQKLKETYGGHITSRCSVNLTFDQLVLNAFDQLEQFYVDGSASARSKSTTAGLVADFSRIRASIESSSGSEETTTTKRIIPPQLTAQRLGQFLGAQELCWVVEDFHKMQEAEKRYLAQALKVFSDLAAEFPTVKIVAVGATETAREVVEYDPEMAARVSEILVPLMSKSELGKIITNGQSLLNIDMSDLKSRIVRYSMGLPSVCHQLALNACLVEGVVATVPTTVSLSPQNFNTALEQYVRESSDTLKATFDKALRRHKVRKFDNCRLILTALAGGPVEGLLHAEVLVGIQKTDPEYPPGNLTKYLRELSYEVRGNVIRRGTDGKYRFATPLHHAFAQATLQRRKLLDEHALEAFRADMEKLVLIQFKNTLLEVEVGGDTSDQ